MCKFCLILLIMFLSYIWSEEKIKPSFRRIISDTIEIGNKKDIFEKLGKRGNIGKRAANRDGYINFAFASRFFKGKNHFSFIYNDHKSEKSKLKIIDKSNEQLSEIDINDLFLYASLSDMGDVIITEYKKGYEIKKNFIIYDINHNLVHKGSFDASKMIISPYAKYATALSPFSGVKNRDIDIIDIYNKKNFVIPNSENLYQYSSGFFDDNTLFVVGKKEIETKSHRTPGIVLLYDLNKRNIIKKKILTNKNGKELSIHLNASKPVFSPSREKLCFVAVDTELKLTGKRRIPNTIILVDKELNIRTFPKDRDVYSIKWVDDETIIFNSSISSRIAESENLPKHLIEIMNIINENILGQVESRGKISHLLTKITRL